MWTMTGVTDLLAKLMYVGGLRVLEVLWLRVQDISFSNGYLIIYDGKGGNDRTTLLAKSLVVDIQAHLLETKALFELDRVSNVAGVYLPNALDNNYPNAGIPRDWQYVFPSKTLSKDPKTGSIRRHHLNESVIQKSIRAAKYRIGIDKRVTSHTLHHSFAMHLLEAVTNIRVVQKLLGHADVKTTEIYTHILQQNLQAVVSPLERLNINNQ